jgi:hypothetical protein
MHGSATERVAIPSRSGLLRVCSAVWVMAEEQC